MSTTKETSQAVSVIGLGAMGSKLAELLLNDEYDVTVWNRTASKAEKLVQDGATLASSATEAVKASPIVIICVYDYKASDSILNTEKIISVLEGRTLIQFTSGSPKEVRNNHQWAHEHGAGLLPGWSNPGRPESDGSTRHPHPDVGS